MRPRTLSLLLTLGVFLGGLALVWVLGGGGGGEKRHAEPVALERIFAFPLNSSPYQVTVRSPWNLGHMTPQDDQVELTLEGKCATAHLYAYLSTNWDDGPLRTAAVILGTPLHPRSGPAPRVVRHDADSAIVVSSPGSRGVTVLRAPSPRDYNTLVVEWQGKPGCTPMERARAARELGRLFETFTVFGEGSAGFRRLQD